MRWCSLLLLPFWVAADPTGQGLVFPQANCRIRCENGGMCAFSFSDPSIHSCICLIGVYSGDRCQFKIGEDKTQAGRAEDAQNKQKAVEQEKAEARRREEEARMNDQRRREYERKIQEEEARTRAQEVERQRYQEEYRRREEERRQYEEQHRQEMSRREEMERNRVITTQQNKDRATTSLGDREEQKTQEEQRIREEQRRKEDLKKLLVAREEKRRKEEEEHSANVEKTRQEQGRRVENYDSDELTDEDLEPDHEPETVRWENDSGSRQNPPTEEISEETTIARPPSNNLGAVVNVLEHAATKAAEEHGIDLGEEIMTEPYLEEEAHEVEGDEGEHDEKTVGAVAEVLEQAAERTADEHSIELTTMEEGEKKDDNEDYWDHHPPKEDLDYEVSKVMDSEEELQRDQAIEKKVPPGMDVTEDHVREYDLEEEGDGWMVKKTAESHKLQESGSESAAFTLVNLLLLLRYLFF